MIVTFQSKAGGDVIMFGDVARRLMETMGKSPEDKGIVTVDQLPDAIARLRAAMAQDKERHARLVAEALDPAAADDKPVDAGPAGAAVSLTQRAVPLLELLELAWRKRAPVVWGV